MKTIKINNEIVGSLSKFVMEGDAEITYWIDRKYWGRGIATTALNTFWKLNKADQFMDVSHLTISAHKRF